MSQSLEKVTKNTPKIYLINKPEGPSSFDIVRDFKKKFPRGTKHKLGHFGTLDPFASGLLLIGSFGATKLMNEVHDSMSKTYVATGIIGKKTDSGDHTGNIIDVSELDISTTLFLDNLKNDLSDFIGDFEQSPPAFSASKFNGKPLYEYARKGEMIAKDSVKRTLYSGEVISFNYPDIEIEFEVSSGTYIRTLFEQLLEKQRQLGYLRSLRRTKIGNWSLKDSIDYEDFTKLTLEEIPSLNTFDFIDYKKVSLEDHRVARFLNGCSSYLNSVSGHGELNSEDLNLKELDKCWVFANDGACLGLGVIKEKELHPIWPWC
tara:strand:- start:5749 stop:6702 length:954 start_codon:yes stop_codon:yes gene_type:complete